jgi:hypothetical protein
VSELSPYLHFVTRRTPGTHSSAVGLFPLK